MPEPTTTALRHLARLLNTEGWSCNGGVHEPGEYDRCDECREVCDELAEFIAPLIARTKVEAVRDARFDFSRHSDRSYSGDDVIEVLTERANHLEQAVSR